MTMPKAVASAYAQFSPEAQNSLSDIRAMLLDEAKQLDVGRIEETLKWGQPSYLTPETKAGSTIRLGWRAAQPDHVQIFVNCQTDLVGRISTQFPEAFTFEGTRCLSISMKGDLPEVPIRAALGMALTYHRAGKSAKG